MRPDKTSSLIGVNLFDTQMVFLKELLSKKLILKKSRRQKNDYFPGGVGRKELNKIENPMELEYEPSSMSILCACEQ